MHRVPLLLVCFIAFFAMCVVAETPAPVPPAPSADGTMPALVSIAGHGMMDAHPYADLEELSDMIGGRVTGSPEAAKAVQWGIAKMKAIGLENVHAEPWQLSRGWTRGIATAELVEPIQHRLNVDSMGWVGSTPKNGATAELVPVNINDLDGELQRNTANWSGKILIIVKKGEPPKEMTGIFAKFSAFLKKAWEAHAVAVIGGQGGSHAAGMHLTHTGSMGFDAYYDIPVVSMTAEDQSQLERFLDRGKTVRLKLNVQNTVTSGPVESANVVGEIRGSEHPEEVVVVGGHLDSWDLAQGATDDGCGVATTLGAAEAIVASGFKPRRTIRFVLFTGEEQGLLGSVAYTKTHAAEMANHLGAVILDNGQGPVVSLNLGGRKDLIPVVEKFADSVKAFGEVKVDDKAVFGTDAGPFVLTGLPGINMGQDSPEYKYTHHSSVDTFDKVQADLLTRDATLVALTSYWIASRPERLAIPWPPEKTAKALIEKKQDTILKAFGVWPFGDLGKESEKEEKDKAGVKKQ
jgi:carboxypeptidase Q